VHLIIVCVSLTDSDCTDSWLLWRGQWLLVLRLKTAVLFWKQKSTVYNLLAPVAEDFVCTPASQAYVERIFSVCGILCGGRRSSMQQSLEMCVCVWNWIRKCCMLLDLLYEQCGCVWQQHSNSVLFWKQCL